MKVVSEKFGDPDDKVMLIYVEHEGSSQCDEIDHILVNESFDIDGEPNYLQIWNQVCEDIFGSWSIRAKNIRAGNWALYYPLSKKGFVAKMQENHFNFVSNMATMEMERITTLINKKYGEQLVLHMREN